MNDIIMRPLVKNDWERVAMIYGEGIATKNATFQVEIPSWEEWDNGHLTSCRIVADLGGKVVGWAALSRVSNRCVYSGVGEVSVYVGKKYFGQKIGSSLLKQLIVESESNGIWTLQAGIFPENMASLVIHKNQGFREVGYREMLGKMDDDWRDVVLLECRSTIVGT